MLHSAISGHRFQDVYKWIQNVRSVYVSVCVSIFVSLRLSVCLFVYLSTCISVWMSVRLSACNIFWFPFFLMKSTKLKKIVKRRWFRLLSGPMTRSPRGKDFVSCLDVFGNLFTVIVNPSRGSCGTRKVQNVHISESSRQMKRDFVLAFLCKQKRPLLLTVIF